MLFNLLLLLWICGVSETSGCDKFDINVASFDPDQASFVENATANVTCTDKFIVSWAKSVNNNSGIISCTASNEWVPDSQDDFTGTVGCVACTDSVGCTEGSCKDGVCECKTNFKKSPDDPRLCEAVQCPVLNLTNQIADSDGPYDVDTVVKVTCAAGFYVDGTADAKEQTLICTDSGKFDVDLKPCVAIKCPDLTLTNQQANSSGPYNVDTVVKVTCSERFHVNGTSDDTEQTLTCQNDGSFDMILKPCVQCVNLSLTNQSADIVGPYDVDSVVNVTCSDGFHVNGTDNDTAQFLACTKYGIFNQTLKPCVDSDEQDDSDEGETDKKKVPVEAIVGGTIGGVMVVLFASVFVVVIMKKTATRVAAATVKVTVNGVGDGTIHTSDEV